MDSVGKKSRNRLWRFLLPIAVLGFFLFKLDTAQIVEALLSSRLNLVGAALVVFAIPIPLRAWRWQIIMKTYGIHYGWRDTLILYLIGYAGQFFLPTGLGDTIRTLYLVEDAHSPGKSFVTVLLDKTADYSSYVFFGMFGMYFFSSSLGLHITTGVFVTAGAVVLVLLAILIGTKLKSTISQQVERYVSKKAKHLAIQTGSEVWRELTDLTLRRVMIFGVMSVFIGLIHNSSFYLLCAALNLKLSYLQALAIAGLLNMIVSAPFLSMSIGGLGIREGSLVAIFSLFSRTPESAIAISLLLFAVSVVWHCVALLAWFTRPIKLRNLGRQIKTFASKKDWRATVE